VGAAVARTGTAGAVAAGSGGSGAGVSTAAGEGAGDGRAGAVVAGLADGCILVIDKLPVELGAVVADICCVLPSMIPTTAVTARTVSAAATMRKMRKPLRRE
jgi:hypothetical protein